MPLVKTPPWCKAPVEIWTIIIEAYLSGSDLTCMHVDPLRNAVNIPAVLARWYAPYAPKCLFSRRRDIMLVSKAWRDAAKRVPMPYMVVSHQNDYDKTSISIHKALRIRGELSSPNYPSDEIWRIEDALEGKESKVEILTNVSGLSVVSLSEQFTQLKVLAIEDHPRHGTYFNRFKELVFLDFTVWSRCSTKRIGGFIYPGPFKFEHLTTLHLRLWASNYFADTEGRWTLPSLRHLQVTGRKGNPIRPGDWDICLDMFGETLLTFMFEIYSEAQSSDNPKWQLYHLDWTFWKRLPKLRSLAANLNIFVFKPPIKGHPLSALIDTSLINNESFDRMKYYMEDYPSIHTVSLPFTWRRLPEKDLVDFPGGFGLSYNKGSKTYYTDGIIALRLSSYCRRNSCRLEDRWGNTLEEWRKDPKAGLY